MTDVPPGQDDDTAWPENSEDKRDPSESGVRRPDQGDDAKPSRDEPQPATGGGGANGQGGFGA